MKTTITIESLRRRAEPPDGLPVGAILAHRVWHAGPAALTRKAVKSARWHQKAAVAKASPRLASPAPELGPTRGCVRGAQFGGRP